MRLNTIIKLLFICGVSLKGVCKSRVGTCLPNVLDNYSKMYHVPTQNFYEIFNFILCLPKIFKQAPPMSYLYCIIEK